jgi:hypothetical protein
MGHNIEQGAGGLSFVEIQRVCGICPKTFEIDCSLIDIPVTNTTQHDIVLSGRLVLGNLQLVRSVTPL